MKDYIQINLIGWSGYAVRIESSAAPTKYYYNTTPREAERRYREKYYLQGKHLARV